MDTINFTRGVPANESFPIDELIDAAQRRSSRRTGAAMLQYGPSLGFQPLREWLAEWQGVTVDRVLTGNGSLQLIEFLCLHMLKPGDVVFTESPTLRPHASPCCAATARRSSASRSRPTARTSRRSSARSRRRVPKFFYVIPDFQNPAGATCSGAKRRQIVGAGRAPRLPARRRRARTGCFAIAAARSRRCTSWRRERTLHMSSFTKLIAPGVRTGFMIGEPALIAKLAKVAEDTYISPGYVAQGSPTSGAAGAAAAADRAAEGALRAAARRLPRGDRQVHAGRGRDAPRRRVLHLAHAAGRRQHDRGSRDRPQRAGSTSPTASPFSRRAAASASSACRSARCARGNRRGPQTAR